MFPRILKKLKAKLFPARRKFTTVIWTHDGACIRIENMEGDPLWPGDAVAGHMVTRGRVIIPEALIKEIRYIP